MIAGLADVPVSAFVPHRYSSPIFARSGSTSTARKSRGAWREAWFVDISSNIRSYDNDRGL